MAAKTGVTLIGSGRIMRAAAKHAGYMPVISAMLRSPSAFREQRHNQQPSQICRLTGSCPKRWVSGTKRLPRPDNLIWPRLLTQPWRPLKYRRIYCVKLMRVHNRA